MDALEVCLACEEECAICLDELEEPVSLRCAHAFCSACWKRHASTSLAAGRAVACPSCSRPIPPAELKSLHGDAELSQLQERALAARDELAVLGRRVAGSRRDEALFRRAAQRAHWKKCPQCHATIEKNRGCDHMRCRCGAAFNWSSAPTVVPCTQVHLRGDNNQFLGWRCWGQTCPGCSPIATLKLAAARAAVATATAIAVPTGAAVVAGAAGLVLAVSAVPASVCLPLAAIYEPIRRRSARKAKKRPKNPFLIAAGAVPMTVVACAYMCACDPDD